ncbi:MAG: DUF5309 family protein [Acidobacteria bacterium]|nr:DUF5309 family protein [Acidobacteriota bacterium]
MAQLTGTSDVYDLRNTEEAETVEDLIYRLDPQDTWAYSNARRKKVNGVKHEWLFEALSDATVVGVVEGDDATFAVVSPATRVSNEAMIMRKTVLVSDTMEVVDKYGSKSTAARFMLKYGLELKRDVEKAYWGKQAHTVGAGGSARVSAGMASMIYSNVVKCGGATGSITGFSSGVWVAPIDGTSDGSFDEADLQSALQLAWTAGGDPSRIILGATGKRRIAAFTGAAAYQGFQTNQGKVAGAVISAVDVYVSDFGSHTVTINRYCPTDTVFCIDPEYISLGFLRPMKKVPLAKTGDADKEMLIVEFTPICDNPLAHAQIIDCSF